MKIVFVMVGANTASGIEYSHNRKWEQPSFLTVRLKLNIRSNILTAPRGLSSLTDRHFFATVLQKAARDLTFDLENCSFTIFGTFHVYKVEG